MQASVNAPEKVAPTIPKWVWFGGSTALSEGQGVCYNFDYGTATAKDGRRFNRVELPTITNNKYFAGVAARAYGARSGGQFIEINTPGSVCNVLSKYDSSSTDLGTVRLTCEAGGDYAGYFRYEGFPGEGSAIVLQKVDRSSAAGKCFAKLETGEPSCLVEDVSTNTDGLADGGATTFMVGGVSYVSADISTGGDATFTMADATLNGLRKAFVCQAAQTNDVVVTVTNGLMGVGAADPSSALSTVKLDADEEETTLRWDAFDDGGLWVVTHSVGATLA